MASTSLPACPGECERLTEEKIEIFISFFFFLGKKLNILIMWAVAVNFVRLSIFFFPLHKSVCLCGIVALLICKCLQVDCYCYCYVGSQSCSASCAHHAT